MTDPDSYGLYCSMLLQEHQQHGTLYHKVDPSVIEACRAYIAGDGAEAIKEG